MRQFTTVDLNKQVGDITEAAAREPVMITRHRKPRYVLMSYEHYQHMQTSGDPRRVYRTEETPEDLAALFAAEVDRLAQGEGYDDEP